MITQEQKTIKNKLGIILIGVLSLFACSQKIEKLPTRPLNGQIFVVTQGRANITLGGVTIAAIPVEDTLGKQISRWNLLNDDLNNYQEKHTNLNCAHNYFGFILDYIPSYWEIPRQVRKVLRTDVRHCLRCGRQNQARLSFALVLATHRGRL